MIVKQSCFSVKYCVPVVYYRKYAPAKKSEYFLDFLEMKLRL